MGEKSEKRVGSVKGRVMKKAEHGRLFWKTVIVIILDGISGLLHDFLFIACFSFICLKIEND